MLDRQTCERARKAKDPRFDGLFYVAVHTTNIYCRPICPVTHVKEDNITYYETALEAAQKGYRPCLRCRPDSAPGSPVWRGVNTTFDRAIRLINDGYLQNKNTEDLAATLGIGDRYLRKIFQDHLGVSPKTFAIYHQCLFAKNLLHSTNLSVTEIAFASGFKSIRRFNDAFKAQVSLSPREIRRTKVKKGKLMIYLPYRPPYDWAAIHEFLSKRLLEPMEWLTDDSYGRTIHHGKSKGSFTATHDPVKNKFKVELSLDDISGLKPVVDHIRRILDLDVDSMAVDEALKSALGPDFPYKNGTRIPGVWNIFEAGIRAILGQQISVKAAHRYCMQLVEALGEPVGDHTLFPTPQSIAESDLSFLRIPQSKKDTLRRLSTYMANDGNDHDPQAWIGLKGIGPWTVQYAQIRGQSQPDIYMESDLGVIKIQDRLPKGFSPEMTAPWRSYLTLQCWRQL